MYLRGADGRGIASDDVNFSWLWMEENKATNLFRHVLKKTGRAYPGPTWDFDERNHDRGRDYDWVEKEGVMDYAVRLLDMPVSNWKISDPQSFERNALAFVNCAESISGGYRESGWRIQPGRVGIFLSNSRQRYSSYGSRLELRKGSYELHHDHAVLGMFYDEEKEAGCRMRHGKQEAQESDQGRLLPFNFEELHAVSPDPSSDHIIRPGDIVSLDPRSAQFIGEDLSMHDIGDDLSAVIEEDFDSGRQGVTSPAFERRLTENEKRGWVMEEDYYGYYEFIDRLDPILGTQRQYVVLEREVDVLYLALDDRIVRLPAPLAVKAYGDVDRSRDDAVEQQKLAEAIADFFDDRGFYSSCGLINQFILNSARAGEELQEIMQQIKLPCYQDNLPKINKILALRGMEL